MKTALPYLQPTRCARSLTEAFGPYCSSALLPMREPRRQPLLARLIARITRCRRG